MLTNRVLTTKGPRSTLEDAAWTDGKTRVVVCDGIGGVLDGDIAAQAVLSLASKATFEVIKAEAVGAVEAVTHRRSGTTCTVALLDGSTLRWLHCGDSALWLVTTAGEPASIQRLTDDHSRWGALVKAGDEPKTVRKHYKHVLDSYVMPGESTTWDEDFVQIPPTGKVWLFGTSDGFHEAFEDENGVVDTARLLAGLRDILGMSEGDAQIYMDGCAAQTRDNATLAIWRVR